MRRSYKRNPPGTYGVLTMGKVPVLDRLVDSLGQAKSSPPLAVSTTFFPAA